MIRFEGVQKRFAEHTVLDGLDFTVAPGEFVSLIGPSGSGKTTVLRLVMTLEQVSAGRIYLDGRPLSHMFKRGREVPADDKYQRQLRTRIGMVFQQFNLFPNMRVLQNITEAPIHALGVAREAAEQRARDLLDMVGMSAKIDAHPGELSGGQQQRVAIARALAMQPDVLLLDEVTSALDPELVAGVLGLLKDIAEHSEITFLCVTHEMNFAREVSDRVMMLDGGAIVEDAAPEKLFTDPDQERTRSFLRAVLDRN